MGDVFTDIGEAVANLVGAGPQGGPLGAFKPVGKILAPIAGAALGAGGADFFGLGGAIGETGITGAEVGGAAGGALAGGLEGGPLGAALGGVGGGFLGGSSLFAPGGSLDFGAAAPGAAGAGAASVGGVPVAGGAAPAASAGGAASAPGDIFTNPALSSMGDVYGGGPGAAALGTGAGADAGTASAAGAPYGSVLPANNTTGFISQSVATGNAPQTIPGVAPQPSGILQDIGVTSPTPGYAPVGGGGQSSGAILPGQVDPTTMARIPSIYHWPARRWGIGRECWRGHAQTPASLAIWGK